VVSVLFGVVLVFLPGAHLLALVWVIGIYVVALGIAFIAYSYRLRMRELRRGFIARANSELIDGHVERSRGPYGKEHPAPAEPDALSSVLLLWARFATARL
jgi:hypothetical protein